MFKDGQFRNLEYEVRLHSANGEVIYIADTKDAAITWINDQRENGSYRTDALFVIQKQEEIVAQYYDRY